MPRPSLLCPATTHILINQQIQPHETHLGARFTGAFLGDQFVGAPAAAADGGSVLYFTTWCVLPANGACVNLLAVTTPGFS